MPPFEATAIARGVGIKTQFQDLRRNTILYLPIEVHVFAQGASAAVYSNDKFRPLSADEVGARVGYGSPANLAVRELLPVNGDGVGTIPVWVYPLSDDGAGVAAAGAIAPTGTLTASATLRVAINGILSEQFTLGVGADPAAFSTAAAQAVNAILEQPMIGVAAGSTVNFTAKWKGSSGNGLYIEVIGDAEGMTFAITQPTGGAANPALTPAINQLGTGWAPFILNCLEVADTTALDALRTLGEGRWGPNEKRPLVAFCGNTDASVTAATAVSKVRTSDRVNSLLVAPGSKSLPFVVAARQLARIAKVAQDNPPVDYAGQIATGIEPGPDSDQWDFTARDTALKDGASTIEVIDGEVHLSKIITFYAPTGQPVPPYRKVVTIVKLMNFIHALRNEFEGNDWKGAVLIPDDQEGVTNPMARKPKHAKARVAGIIDAAAAAAIIADPEFAKASINVWIDEQDGDQLNIEVTAKVSGNTDQIGVTFNFGFNYGQRPLAA